MLRISGVWLRLGGKQVLRDVHLEHSEGVGCLLGPNGAGKTTILRTAAGLLKPQRGRVEVMGRDVYSLDPRSRARLVAYLPQEVSIRFPFTALEVVLMGRTPHVNPLRGPNKRDVELAMEALKAVGIEHLAHRRFTTLSGGEKRLVLMARVLAQDTPVMLLDEPTSFLDVRNSITVMELVSKIVSERKRIALVTLHDPLLAALFCNHVYIVSGGRIVAGGPPSEVMKPSLLEEIYGTPFHEIQVRGHRVPIPLPKTWRSADLQVLSHGPPEPL